MRLSRDSLACIVATLLAGLVYFNALNNPFVFDDNRTIVDNGSILDISNLRAIVTRDVTRPIVNLSYAIDRHLWGMAPFGFHVTSVLLHMLNVGLLFQLVRRLVADHLASSRGAHSVIQPTMAAFTASALLAVHPLMTQAVGYLSGRSEVLCASFFLGGLLAARRWAMGGGAGWWILTFGLWVASMLTKEVGVVFPVVLLLIDRVFWSPADGRRRWLSLHAPLLGLAVVGALARIAVFVTLERPAAMATRWAAALDALIIAWRYLGLLAIPSGQSIFHEIVPAQGLDDSRVLVSAIATAAASAVAWRARRQAPFVTLGVVWFLVLLAPSSALMVLDAGTDMAEHRAYLAACGGFVIAGAAFGELAERGARQRSPIIRWATAAVVTAILLSLSGRTLLRNAIWSSGVSIWTEAVERAPMHWLPRTILGEALHDADRHEDAVAAHRAARALNPGEESIDLKLGFCLAELGRAREARAVFEQLRVRRADSATAPLGLGIVAMVTGDLDEGRLRFREAVTRDPGSVVARQWWARLEETAGNRDEATRLCEDFQLMDPWHLNTIQCVANHRGRRDR